MHTRTRTLLTVLAAAGTLLVPTAPDAVAAVPTCHGKRATIVGHDRPHSRLITGTRGRDVIVGTAGADTIRAGGGNDLVCARAGADRVSGGKGDDRLYGGLDRTGSDVEGTWAYGDTISGGPGDDFIDLGFDPGQTHASWYSRERDTVSYGGSEHGVFLDLHAGRATGEGHDVIVRRAGFVSFRGSPHNDRVYGTVGDDIGGLGRGDDVFRGRAGNDTIRDVYSNSSGWDRMFGGPGDDELTTSGGDKLDGGSGDDVLHSGRDGAVPSDLQGGLGDDELMITWVQNGDHASGGEGNDVLNVIFGDPRLDFPAEADLAGGTVSNGQKVGTIELFESYWLNAFTPLTLHGTAGADQVGYSAPGLTADLGDGDDVLMLGRDDETDDTVDGGGGMDTVDVGIGNDTCTNVEAGPC